MMMMPGPPSFAELVSRLPVTGLDARHLSEIGEQGKRPVDRSEPYPRIFSVRVNVEFLGRQTLITSGQHVDE